MDNLKDNNRFNELESIYKQENVESIELDVDNTGEPNSEITITQRIVFSFASFDARSLLSPAINT